MQRSWEHNTGLLCLQLVGRGLKWGAEILGTQYRCAVLTVGRSGAKAGCRDLGYTILCVVHAAPGSTGSHKKRNPNFNANGFS